MVPPLLGVPVGCAFVTYKLSDAMSDKDDNDNPMYPALLALVSAMAIVLCCITVFECSITTLFVCAFHDMQAYDGAHMSDKLRTALSMPKKKGENKELLGNKSPEKKKEKTSSTTKDGQADNEPSKMEC